MEELFHNLGIDWKLLLAQVANFLILLIILRKFAYGPILRLMTERRNKIDEGVKNADAAEQALEQASEKKEEAISQGRSEALAIVENAKREGENTRQETVRQAQEEAERIVSDAKVQIERDRDEAFRSVQQELGEMVVLASKRLTREAISPEAHQELINQALTDIQRADD